MISTSDASHVNIYYYWKKWIRAQTPDFRTSPKNLINLTGFQIILWGVNNRSIGLNSRYTLVLRGLMRNSGYWKISRIWSDKPVQEESNTTFLTKNTPTALSNYRYTLVLQGLTKNLGYLTGLENLQDWE